jgi:DivIVA domain-containing protein
MLTPADIDMKQFAVTRIKGGYDQVEVDEFLDEVLADYTIAVEKVVRLEQQIARNRAQPVKVSPEAEAQTAELKAVPSVQSVERVLVAAEAVAAKVAADAYAEAEAIKGDAERRAVDMVQEAELKKLRVLEDLEASRTELEKQINELVGRRSTYKSWLKATLLNLEEEEASNG